MNSADTSAIPPGAKVYPLSLDAYHSLGEAGLIHKNTELLYGIVYNKVSKSPLHSTVVLRLLELLRSKLPAGFMLMSEQPISCIDSEPEPDAAIVRGAIEDFRDQHPTTAELVVEVCVTSRNYDRAKLRAYANAGIKEVWIILVPEKRVEVYRHPGPGSFAFKSTVGQDGQVTCATLPAVTLELDSFLQP